MSTTADDRLKKLSEALWNDAELGAKIQARAKEMFPDAKTNEDVFGPMLNPLRAENEKLSKRLSEMQEERIAEKKAAEEAKTRQTLEAQLDAARKNYSLTDEGFDKMVARMKETGNYADADAAAAWVASKTPPAKVDGPTWAPQALNLFGSKKYDEALNELHRDPQSYMDSQLSQFVRDPDAYVAETFGGRAA
ncbi:MAG: hypothetical protein KGL39_04955 [Patescibacteria group bacterium]|nr:hypothetical protein [Patescibacteria group bacterium]